VEEEPLWQSPVAKCDTTVLILDETVEGLDNFTLASSMPTNKKEDRIYVIGHPKGGELSFSFQDNTLIDFDDRRLHYRSPTEPGSSGSPIFNEQWELIGLHHAGHNQMPTISGDGTYPANEGITLPAIIKAIAKSVNR
jgi:V8-like Glu-specific endopeptidase